NAGTEMLFNTNERRFRRLLGKNGEEVVQLEARESGTGSLTADVTVDPGGETVTLAIKGEGKTEVFEHVNMDPASENYLVFRIQDTAESLITAIDLPRDPDNPLLPSLEDSTLTGGSLPSAEAFQTAVNRLEKDPTIDMVMASVPASAGVNFIKKVYSGVLAHCDSASEAAKNRIGIGNVPAAIQSDPAEIISMAGTFNSERFILVAPNGVAGAVAGLIGGLDFYQSPTFKTLTGVTSLAVDYSNSTLRRLLVGNVLPVDYLEGKGFIIIKGIDTTGGQISVTRIADRAVRRVKAISDQFIGTLNTEDGRNTLRQQIISFLTQWEKDGALVPSTDGQDPAFLVDVYSSQTDFAQGIVRVDIAVRPVRAIDYIYATILVKI
ncbi:MAG TPA: phage tail sheath C-terminal domain-containing protein, partial [bacterium]|nr:phage tail sheath C-terminal domain-containing protein [bacterium]